NQLSKMLSTYRHLKSHIRRFILLLFIFFLGCQPAVKVQIGWPAITRETKPWTRWWWHGNAQTKEGITAEMEAYQKAGLGGLEITPIYGVHGYEDKFVDYLSPQWMELFMHTLKEAERLDLGIDMATGTGWPFGGPWIGDADACKNMEHTVYHLRGGERLKEKIVFTQAPYLRAIGSPMYGYNGTAGAGPRIDPKKIGIKDLAQPVSANQ